MEYKTKKHVRHIDDGLVRGFVEATRDFNPLHRESERAIQVYKNLQGEQSLEYNLGDGSRRDSYLIVPGALLIQDIGPLTRELVKEVNPSLIRLKQEYKFKTVLLTGSVGRDVETEVSTLYTGLKENGTTECCFITSIKCGAKPIAVGSSTLVNRLPSESGLKTLEQFNPQFEREGKIDFSYLNLLQLEKHGLYLEYWPTEIIAQLWDIWEKIKPNNDTYILYREQSIEIDPYAKGDHFKLNFRIEKPEEKRIGLERKADTQGIINNDLFLRATTKGLEKRVA